MIQQHKILSWAARIAGLIVTLFFLGYFIVEGIPGIIKGNAKGLLYFLLFILPAFAGYVIGWFRPLTGGWLMIVGGILLAGYFNYFDDLKMAFMFGLSSLLVGTCFLAAVNKELL